MEDRRVSLNTYARRNGLPAEAAQVGAKRTFAKATAGSLRPPRCRGRRLESPAGVAPLCGVPHNGATPVRDSVSWPSFQSIEHLIFSIHGPPAIAGSLR